jgi:hypothetical protein
MTKTLRNLATRLGNKLAGKPVIAVVEWTDESRDPWMYLANDHEGARRAVAKDLIRLLPDETSDSGLEYIDSNWVARNPAPDLDDPAAVEAWLDVLREDTTDAWTSFYEFGTRPTGSNFTDAR